ncbi:hypothetical protein V5799_009993 [Amblyomma americanum]|uniref:Uncharacterized protein n=1 Tax=Amblyomma americanum TaxID=6943 RepID=A0AAQ4FA26_AMBAM
MLIFTVVYDADAGASVGVTACVVVLAKAIPPVTVMFPAKSYSVPFSADTVVAVPGISSVVTLPNSIALVAVCLL